MLSSKTSSTTSDAVAIRILACAIVAVRCECLVLLGTNETRFGDATCLHRLQESKDLKRYLKP